MFIAKLKTPAVILFATLVLGAGSLVYCTGQGAALGQTRSNQDGPPNPLEAVRKENELLKINLRVTLEKIQALEAEVKGLKTRLQTTPVPLGLNSGQLGQFGQIGGQIGQLGGQIGQIGQMGGQIGQIGQIGGQVGQLGQIGGQFGQLGQIGGPHGPPMDPNRLKSGANLQTPDSAAPVERALKAWRGARDEKARNSAIEQMEKALNNLKEKGNRPATEVK